MGMGSFVCFVCSWVAMLLVCIYAVGDGMFCRPPRFFYFANVGGVRVVFCPPSRILSKGGSAMKVTVDDLGRILLPKKARAQLGLEKGDKLEIHVKDDEIAVRKSEESTEEARR